MQMRVTMIFCWTKKNNIFYDNQKKPCTAGFFYIRMDLPANTPNRLTRLLAAVMVSGLIFAQQQVTGLVIDRSTSEPIEGVNITAEKTPRLIVRFSDQLLDLDKPVTITVNGEEKFNGTVKRSAREIIKSLHQRADPASVATASVTLKL